MIEKMMAYGSAHGDPGEDRGRPQDPLVGPQTHVVHDAASVRRQAKLGAGGRSVGEEGGPARDGAGGNEFICFASRPGVRWRRSYRTGRPRGPKTTSPPRRVGPSATTPRSLLFFFFFFFQNETRGHGTGPDRWNQKSPLFVNHKKDVMRWSVADFDQPRTIFFLRNGIK